MKPKIIDLSHEIDPNIPTWGGDCGFWHRCISDYDQIFRVMEYRMIGSCGTHMDAPSHMVPGAREIDSFKVEELWGPAFVVDVTAKVQKNSGYLISSGDILEFEDHHGLILPGGFVLGFTGWDARWKNPESYRNVVEGKMVFPTFSSGAADLLLERNVAGIGIDTFSPDGPDSSYPVHKKILGAGKIIFENLANLKMLPPKGSDLLVLPLKIKGGTESPVRAVGLVYS